MVQVIRKQVLKALVGAECTQKRSTGCKTMAVLHTGYTHFYFLATAKTFYLSIIMVPSLCRYKILMMFFHSNFVFFVSASRSDLEE